MENFTAEYLANLTADLTTRVLAAAGRRVREAIVGTEAEQALRRALRAGVWALVNTSTTAAPEDRALLEELFTDFFDDPFVAHQVAKLLRGHFLDREQLVDLFSQLGYNLDTLPELDFAAGVGAFEAAFVAAAVAEPALQDEIGAANLVEQTRLQRDLLAEMQRLADSLREALAGGGIQADRIVADNVVNGVQIILQQTTGSIPPATPIREAYLVRTARECGALRLLGIDTGAGHAGGEREGDVQLEAIYIHLDTVQPAPPEDEERAKQAMQPEALERQQQSLTALEAVARFPRLALIGGPGAGKSTFASYLTLCLATHELPAEDAPFSLVPERHLPGWPERLWPLPVRVVLRDFARELSPETGHGTADLLWQHIERRLAPLGEFAPTLKRALIEGDALVILDGLDEVPEATPESAISPRDLVLQAVEDFAQHAFPNARYMVTCRVASYVSPWTLPAFQQVRLAEFNQDKRDLFCQLWYKELARRGQLEQDMVLAKVAGLREAIRRPDLARMAGNPLLLTVMALVHAREPELPEARALLYEKCVDVLLWLWERRKEDERRPADLLTLLQEAQVDRTFFVRALDKLAFDVHQAGGAQEGTADIRASTLERRLEMLHPDRDPSWARRVATFIRERAGLLVERQADVLDPVLAFPHRTFQEYLAACWLTEGEDTAPKAAELACTGDHWWEVIKLAAGRLLYVERKISQPLLLLDWLCPSGMPVGEDRWRMALLAGEVLLELKPEQMLREEALRPQVEDRLDQVRQRLCRLLRESRLTARERAEGGNILAQLGDPRFREDAWFLPDEPLLGFVEIPEGLFLMGSDKERDPMAYDDELPQHEVDLPTYYVARYPVTVAQFHAFVEDSGYEPGDPDSLRGVSNHPVMWVSWHEALKYCDWLTERLRAWDETPELLATLLREEGWAITLPSEAEWEKAARGTDGRIFPWGEQADPERANYGDTGIGTTSAVGCFPDGASPYEVEDLSGNVWEWTRSLWGTEIGKPDFEYPYDPEDGREDLRAADDVRRVLRGGSFVNIVGYVRCASRGDADPDFRDGFSGFRVVASPVRSDL